jgi:hypothetical protein
MPENKAVTEMVPAGATIERALEVPSPRIVRWHREHGRLKAPEAVLRPACSSRSWLPPEAGFDACRARTMNARRPAGLAGSRSACGPTENLHLTLPVPGATRSSAGPRSAIADEACSGHCRTRSCRPAALEVRLPEPQGLLSSDAVRGVLWLGIVAGRVTSWGRHRASMRW